MTDLESSLLADIPKLNADSQAFMRWILDRVIGVGLRDYGPWQAAKDGRDMDREIADELADAVVYTGMRAVRRSLKRARLVEEFKSATCDHWNNLIESDICTGCGANAFETPFDDEPTQSRAVAYRNASAEGVAVSSQGGERQTLWTVNPVPGQVTEGTPSNHHGLAGSSPAPDTAEYPNALGRECEDCSAPPLALHRSGCPYTVVVPANGEVA